MISIADYAEEVFKIFDTEQTVGEIAVALLALRERTGVDTAFAEEAHRIALAKLLQATGKTSWTQEDRKRDFELALLEMLEARNDGDQQVTVGEVITADEIEDLAAIFKLVVTVDGGVRDALQ